MFLHIEYKHWVMGPLGHLLQKGHTLHRCFCTASIVIITDAIFYNCNFPYIIFIFQAQKNLRHLPEARLLQKNLLSLFRRKWKKLVWRLEVVTMTMRTEKEDAVVWIVLETDFWWNWISNIKVKKLWNWTCGDVLSGVRNLSFLCSERNRCIVDVRELVTKYALFVKVLTMLQ